MEMKFLKRTILKGEKKKPDCVAIVGNMYG
jgi:hypothetical protein